MTTIIYVANSDSQDISVFQVNESGSQVRLLQTFPAGGAVMPMTLSPDKKYVYAAIRSEPYRLLVLAIDPDSGALSQRTSIPLVDNMANISVDQQGRYLLAASYSGNKICAYHLDKNGIPLESPLVLNTGAHPHQITTTSDQQFVYVSLLGEDRLDYYQLKNPRRNKPENILNPIAKTAVKLPVGAGPRHFVLSSDEKFIYLLDELTASLHALKRNKTTGAAMLLETYALLQPDASLKPWAADVHRTPAGHFIYASERTSNTLIGFKMNAGDGRLTSIGHWETEQQPRAFAISPDGRFLAAVGQKSNSMTLYSIHPDSGQLQPVNRHATGMNPGWVEILSLHTHK